MNLKTYNTMTLQEIKNTYAIEQGYDDWDDFRYCYDITEHINDCFNDVIVRAQKLALEKAAENAWINGSEFSRCGCEIDTTSITNPENLIR